MMASRAALRSSFMPIVYRPDVPVESGGIWSKESMEINEVLQQGFPCLTGLGTRRRASPLFVFLVDHFNFALFVEDGVEGFGLPQHDFAELLFLEDGHGLQLYHFEHGEKGDDHGVARRTSFKEAHQIYAGIVARQNLAAQLSDHLRYRERFMAQFDARDFSAALQHLLEHLDQVDQGDHKFA